MNYSKPSFRIVIEGDEFSYTAYDDENKNVILMHSNDEHSFEKLITFIYDTINGQTTLREKQH